MTPEPAMTPELPSLEEWHRMGEGERAAEIQRLTARTVQPQAIATNGQAAATPLVSIIVTSRNYGRFLRDCLQSCLDQTIKPIEVVYSDDASTDNSVSIARKFPAVRTIAHPAHTGVAAARNRGVSASRGEVLIHVDGDDQLPQRFVQLHLDALREAGDTCPFAYGPAQAFGLHATFWDVPKWGDKFLWDMNFCNTSSAIRRWAFEAAGGWRENPSGTMWDWDLFLRASRFGSPAPSQAYLLYRQHAASWSHSHEVEADFSRRISLLGEVRRNAAKVSVACVYSGRLPGLLPKWFASLKGNMAAAGLTGERSAELLILDNSPTARGTNALYREAAKHAAAFASIRIVACPDHRHWTTEQERRNGVSIFLARAYSQILAETSGELVFTIEDDVILPKSGFAKLLKRATSGYPMPAAVAGVYQNRHTGKGFVGGWFVDGRPREIDKLPKDDAPMAVDITGTGCLLFWRGLAPQVFQSHLNGAAGPIAAHDWAFTNAVRRSGRDVSLMPGVRCRHYKTTTEWV